ncbi:dihydroorotase [Archaeoglobales archaeon]|nr:MAG: dihydroorotase [Archaeoglobales archaeon]
MIYGKIYYKGRVVEAGVEVEDGIIKKVGKEVKGKEVRGLILPAAIDVHVHFRDFNEKHKETIETGSLSALYGGVCLVVDQPNTNPVVDCYEVYDRRMKMAKKSSYVDYTLNLALTNKNAKNIGEIVKKIEKKYYLPAIGEVFTQHENDELQITYKTLKELSVSKLLTIHAEDPRFVGKGSPNFKYRLPKAEIEAVKKCLQIGKYHFCHISTIKALQMISKSNSTCEITPHHFLLSEDDFKRLDGLINVNPPLRSKDEVEKLLKNVGLAEVIASDHAPHTIEEKLNGSSGFPGVETLYPLILGLIVKNVLNLNTIEKLTKNPAKIFGFERYGDIEVGNYANLAIFDLKKVEKIDVEKLHSKANWTPYEGFDAVFPEKVFIRGVEALNTEVLVDKGFGKILECV